MPQQQGHDARVPHRGGSVQGRVASHINGANDGTALNEHLDRLQIPGHCRPCQGSFPIKVENIGFRAGIEERHRETRFGLHRRRMHGRFAIGRAGPRIAPQANQFTQCFDLPLFSGGKQRRFAIVIERSQWNPIFCERLDDGSIPALNGPE